MPARVSTSQYPNQSITNGSGMKLQACKLHHQGWYGKKKNQSTSGHNVMQRPSTIWQEANEETKQPHTVKHKLDGHHVD